MNNELYSSPRVTNYILWSSTASSTGKEVYNDFDSGPLIRYCDIVACLSGGAWDTSMGSDGGGNIDEDPLFADPCNCDCHLKSEGGRWNANNQTWVLDSVTNPYTDTANLYTSFAAELSPHSCRVNMGAYINTKQASKSPVIPSVCCESYECAGQPFGDATCDGKANLALLTC